MTKRRLTLELELTGSDSISGRLLDAAGSGTEFVGWLGLAGVIESRLAEPLPPETSTESSPSPSTSPGGTP